MSDVERERHRCLEIAARIPHAATRALIMQQIERVRLPEDLENDGWKAILPRTAARLTDETLNIKRNGVELEPCAHCTVCERTHAPF